MYNLIWNNEIIDTADTMDQAEYLKFEYQMAYQGIVTIEEADDDYEDDYEDDGQPDWHQEWEDFGEVYDDGGGEW
jgi:hypothetical protein